MRIAETGSDGHLFESVTGGIAMSKIKWLLFLWVFISGPGLSSAASYYEGKTLTVVVGYKPGGGYDNYARLLAKHLPKYIPGNPAVIIQNMPGANSIIAANHTLRRGQT